MVKQCISRSTVETSAQCLTLQQGDIGYPADIDDGAVYAVLREGGGMKSRSQWCAFAREELGKRNLSILLRELS